MRHYNRLLLSAMALLLAFALTGCSVRDVATTLVKRFLASDTETEEEDSNTYAAAGGTIRFPDEMDTEERYTALIQDGNLYISYNGISLKNSGYFYPAGNSITVTSYSSTESSKKFDYKVAVWQLSEDERYTTYVPDSTVYFLADNTCQTATISGLDPNYRYKVVLSYDSSMYLTGGLLVEGLASDELKDIEGEE